ncbi:oxidoreductase [Aspergillus novoparasiticus]|uniref:Oxidoreductase n=1 Tax=Aspergillus novoparasiticus TaxID=986946 RepID=A0A5N6F3Q2_9EURO|nr:oxidoreductase [Aspergillus novoparasiticus]
MPYSPKTILITGCSAHGIGAALAIKLAEQVPESITSLANVYPLPLDVTDLTTISDVVCAVTECGYGLDILINNAEIGYIMPLLDADLDQAKQVYKANVWGLLRLVQACSDLLITSKGRIINMSSVGTVVNTSWIDVYSSSKAAVTQLSETLRLELAPWGVTVVCLMASTITTAFHANEPEVVLLPTSRYAAIRLTISDWATGRAGPKGCSADEFAASIVDDVLGSTGGLVWKGPNSAAVQFVSRWFPTWLLVRLSPFSWSTDRIMSSLGLKNVRKSCQQGFLQSTSISIGIARDCGKGLLIRDV